jgi:hypothetical protein
VSEKAWKQFERRVSRDHGVERQPITGERDGSDSQEHPDCGVYAIVNSVTDVAYIGCSVNMARRRKNHRTHLRMNRHHNIHLQRAWNKYGEAAFDYFVLQRVAPCQLAVAERFWCEAHWSSYNIADAGGRPPDLRGRKVSEETKAKMSFGRKGISGSGIKLDPEKARAIKALKPTDWPEAYRRSGRWKRTPSHDVAVQFGVHRVLVNGIWSGKRWPLA